MENAYNLNNSDNSENREIFIVVTQTGTILSRILKRITGAEYNHVSVSLDPELRKMYSFGRKHAYNPWRGGFVTESPEYGTFKRFSETRAVVLSVPVTDKTFCELDEKLNLMYVNKKDYHYDSLGMVLAGFNIIYRRERHFYCSEFVRTLLCEYGIEETDFFEPIVQPVHFLSIPNGEEIYRGRLQDFSKEMRKKRESVR